MLEVLSEPTFVHPPVYKAKSFSDLAADETTICSKQLSLCSTGDTTTSTLCSTPSLDSDNDTEVDISSLEIEDRFEELEIPPPYTPALFKSGYVWIKPELDAPSSRTAVRKWKNVKMELNNTQLKLTYSKVGGLISNTFSYTLQFAEVGLASDYNKREHTVRLRVESKQFIFAFETCNEMQSWLVALLMCTSLALPLELRQLPEEVKRTRNRHRDRERRRQRRLAREEARKLKEKEKRLNLQREGELSPKGKCIIKHAVKSTSTQLSDQIQQSIITSAKTKWDPKHRKSKFSEKDFPHLLYNASWEGKSVLYEGEWSVVRGNRIFPMTLGIHGSQLESV